MIVGYSRAVLKLFLFTILTIVVVGSQTIILAFYRGQNSYIIPLLWQKGVRNIFGIKLIVDGMPERQRHTLFVSNHMSYIDIPVIGSFIMGSFVARGDMSRWPIFGYMGKMQQTIYISRERQDAEKGKASIEKILADGKNLIIFAEGTSTNGAQVLPFKSSLFSLALKNPSGKPLLVQPITISLLEVDGQPAIDDARDLYAWHRDMDMEIWPHIWRFAQKKGATIKITFHEPRDAAHYTDRKALCHDCYNDVSQHLEVPGLAVSTKAA